MAVVILRDAIGDGAELGQVQALAFGIGEQGMQGCGIEAGVAPDLEAFDRKGLARGYLGPVRLLDGEPGCG